MAGEKNTLPLNRTKLHRPRVSDDLVLRPHLLDRLNQGLDRKPTLVCVTAEFGKTTLVASCLGLCRRPSACLSLGGNDNDPSLFLSYVIAAIRTLFPQACRDTLELLQSLQVPPSDYVTTSLLNDNLELPEAFVLAIDARADSCQDRATIVVSNATPLIARAMAGRFDLLQKILGRIHMAQRVYDGVVEEGGERFAATDVREVARIPAVEARDHLPVQVLEDDLGRGERETIVAASEMQADWVLVDERLASRTLGLFGVRTMGTLGILLKATELGLLQAIGSEVD